ncbi:MAG: hypothetical protein JO244_12675 [Solirubrobacterales bacterium]|nr:hypothetical protein [Solirubrobacterales bacterium]
MTASTLTHMAAADHIKQLHREAEVSRISAGRRTGRHSRPSLLRPFGRRAPRAATA